jgi:four helix bundle protein
MKENIIVNKTFNFAVEVVEIYKKLTNEKKEYILSRQLLRSGTSIGANVEESEGGYSKKEFVAKLQIAYKEAKETRYWLRLLRTTNYLDENDFLSIMLKLDEILKIIVSILKSSKEEIVH